MHSSTLLSLLFISLAYAQQESEPLRVQHRIVHPNLPITQWSELGTISLPAPFSVSPLGTSATLVQPDTLYDDLVQFAESIDLSLEGAMYQVALERPGALDGVRPTAVVKACHLPGSTSSHLTVHLSPSGIPVAVDHFVAPVPHDGSCPSSSAMRKSYPVLNTTVRLMSPRQPPQPELRTPPPLTPEGEPIAPVPEKSFLQKYWMYMLIVLVALLVSGPAPADEQGGNGGGQGGR